MDDIRRAYQDEDFVKLRAPPPTINNEKDERWTDEECEFEEYDEFMDATTGSKKGRGANILPLVDVDSTNPMKLEGPYVVLLRHGRTPHNNMQVRDPTMDSVFHFSVISMFTQSQLLTLQIQNLWDTALYWVGGSALGRGRS